MRLSASFSNEMTKYKKRDDKCLGNGVKLSAIY